MSDLIDRQVAIDAINTWDKFGVDERSRIVRWHEGLEPYVHLRDVVTAIVNLPPAQTEIIRCKDCKWWSNDDYRECSNPNYDDGYVTPAGFYCGWAERRTVERRKDG